TQVGIALIEIEAVDSCDLRARHRRPHLAEVQAEAGDDLVAVGEGFGKVKPGLEKDDRDPGRDGRNHVSQRDAVVLEGAGENDVRREGFRRPSEDFLWATALEPSVQRLEVYRRVVARLVLCRFCHEKPATLTRVISPNNCEYAGKTSTSGAVV